MKKFINLLYILIIFVFIISTKSFAEDVNKVKVVGNERISLESILVFGDITIGNNFETSDVNLLLKKLYETNFFSNIKIAIENGQMTITVTENPIVNTIVFDGEKAKKYTERLKDLFLLKEKSSYISNNVKSDINLTKGFYRQLGFYFAKINVKVEKLENNRVNLIYIVDKGEKAKIGKISFLGDKKLRDKRLRSIITSQESKFWKVFSQNVYLNEGRIELDKRLLKNYYKNRGYYEVDITSSNVEYNEGLGFILTYTINAGKRYKFTKISLDIDKALDQAAFLGLESNFNEVVGEYYSSEKLTKILNKIDKLSELKELQFINHGITETLEKDGISVLVRIFEGEKFTIERINIVGNSVTNDDVIRSELLVDEGEAYSELLVNKSINELKSRGIFGKVEQKVIEGSSPSLKILEIAVEESATGEISAGAGIGTNGSSIMFALSENNWLGKGVLLNSTVSLAKEKVEGSLLLNNPNYNYTGNAVYAQFDLSSADYGDTSGYESSKSGIRTGTQYEQWNDIFIAPGIAFVHEDIEVKSTASSSIKKMAGTFTNLDFEYSLSFDNRNQSFQPTSGRYTRFIQTLPILQDKSSLLNGFDSVHYKALSEDVIGTMKFYARTIHGVGGDVRLTSRLHIPQSKLRGFESRRIGPKDGTDYVGGNYITALSLESQFPNLLPEDYKTDLSVFLDTGNVWGVDYNSSVDNSSLIRVSAGVSANVFTTIGPLSFTLAQAISKASSDVTETFNFRLGTSF